MRRLLKILAVLILVLVVVAAIAIEVIRRSTIPRNIAIDQVEHLLGVDFELGSVDIGYGGHVALRDIRLTMPFEDEALGSVAAIHVEHTPAWKLLVGSSFEVTHIEIREPVLRMRQDATGQWNFAELIARAAALAGESSDGAKSGGPPPKLPDLSIVDARIEVYDNQQHQLTLAPINVQGARKDLLYDASVQAAQFATVKAELSPGGTWSHRVSVTLADVEQIAEQWTGSALPPIAATLNWQGRAAAGGVTGQLLIDGARFDQITAHGRVAITAGQVVELAVQRLMVTPAPYLSEPLEVASGSVTLDGMDLRLSDFDVLAMGGRVWLEGQADLQLQQGRAQLAWERLAYPAPIQHSGALTVAVAPAYPDKLALDATLDTHGQSPGGAWKTQVQLAALATGTEHIQATVTMPELTWQRDEQVILLQGVEAKLGLADQRVTLQSLTAEPVESLRGFGWYDLETKSWSMRVTGERFPIELQATPHRRYAFEAQGTPEEVQLVEALLTGEGQKLSATGVYRAGRDAPLDLRVTLSQDNVDLAPGDAASLKMERVEVSAGLQGTVQPLALQVAGELDVTNLAVADRLLQEHLQVDLTGRADEKQVAISIAPFEFLQGEIVAGLDYAMAEKQGHGRLEIRRLSIPEALALARVAAPVMGTLDSRFDLTLPRSGDPRVTGQWEAQDLVAADQPIDAFTGRLELHRGRLKIESVEALRGRGRLEAAALMDLGTQQLRADAKLTDWPLRPEDAADNLHASGQVEARIDLPAASLQGDVKLQTRLTLRGAEAGEQTAHLSLQGQTIVLESLSGDILDGALQGSGELRLDAPLRSQLAVSWSDVETAPIARIFPAIDKLAGTYTGHLALAPATVQAGYPASRLTLTVDPRDGRYGEIEIGPLAMTAEVVEDPEAGMRFVLHRSTLAIADGVLHFWGRVSRHLESWYMYAHAEMGLPLTESAEAVAKAREQGVRGLDISQFSRTFAPDMKPVRGRLSGTVRVTQPLDSPRRAYGESRLALRESDLASYGLFAKIYDLLNIGAGRDEPTGDGLIIARLEGRLVRLVNMDYGNRGIRLQLKGQIDDIYQGGESPMSGTAVASAIPLPELPLIDQLIKDFKEALGTLQEGIMGFEISNTVGEPEVRQASLSGALSALKDLVKSDERTDEAMTDKEKAAAAAGRE